MVSSGIGILGKLTFLACFLDTNTHTAISRDNTAVPNNTDLLKQFRCWPQLSIISNTPLAKTGNVGSNTTFRRDRETTVVVEKQYYIFRLCFCSLMYPARKAHAS